MSRTTGAATAMAVLTAAVSACGANHGQPAAATSAVAPRAVSRPAHGGADEVLSASGLGRFEGRCPRGARIWSLRFVNADQATDTISYRVGTGTRREVNVDPGNSIVVRLAPNATRTHEPADRFVAPAGQGRGLARATSVPTTEPLEALIYQGTEPQTLRADVHMALATIGGESGQCVLVGSTINAYSYPN
jgi:hypothetical protein